MGVLTVPYRQRYQMVWNHGLSRAVLKIAYVGHTSEAKVGVSDCWGGIEIHTLLAQPRF